MILLRYPCGGFNAFHQDVHGSVYFPFQMAIHLGPESDGLTQSGHFLVRVAGTPKERKADAAIPTHAGDAVVFCTTHRIAKAAGGWGLMPMQHGVSEVRAQERFALGVPFHHYAGGDKVGP